MSQQEAGYPADLEHCRDMAPGSTWPLAVWRHSQRVLYAQAWLGSGGWVTRPPKEGTPRC